MLPWVTQYCEATGHEQEAQPQRKAAQLEHTVFHLQL